MEIQIQLDDDRAQKLAYIQAQTQQDLSALIEEAIDSRYQQLNRPTPTDPLAKLKRSKSIGFIKHGDSTASSNYKEIVRDYILKKHNQEQA